MMKLEQTWEENTNYCEGCGCVLPYGWTVFCQRCE